MADVLLIKNLNEDQLNSKSLIPVTFQTNISDKDKLVNIFNVLKDKKLVENKKLGIKKSSITLDLFSSNITEVIKELIKNDFMIYGVYILYDNYLGGK
ncbi:MULTISPECIES: UDP-N-acetylmuramoyl-tripeptide--D-alanyl-D-alanine ligase [Anaerococcus]|uniref:UDP-N-acetylmuramoyl-tripeptide--D-alanyl-D- alanine ligase n=1 Tax=Anaerococcus TaxID=165779 RepID=UPI001D95149F|nr:UDP-N-acetylmuramoyl-tripeptide--D-alanyl-D-alanine ligase [Anaerococcus vaginalis]MBS4890115.1 UDP-N-acetylmuramoyl-tripeptide--D-alanyl-D-alanine ligase [Anaerococcus vaginalis]MDU0944946.1 UDP-N-acetylmuramoyl-tripeptide--D-alanyl-D-alanine ligase [Anaerococcus vaginalis]MDU1030646.1 UDP-N-acetylmuramoyl-tripeptide--D-alanyl-D-alanine ligase [Anaerococcus vaginalis]MDU5086977.1 UDP-N-acetylmuramoyl-tripeptide--D-alanyl-D-alanine ligase [Anaerococcus vaginalis]MDU5560765.1 UDP-N-acetylmur